MAASVEFKNIIPTIKIYADIRKYQYSTVPMKGIVKDTEEEIKKKTSRAVNYQGKKWEPLTESYKIRKAKLARGRKADMKYTGKMLGAMGTKVVSPSHGKVFISEQHYPKDSKTGQRPRIDTKTLANIHNRGTGRQPQREFMNISSSFKKKLLQKWNDKPILKILGRG